MMNSALRAVPGHISTSQHITVMNSALRAVPGHITHNAARKPHASSRSLAPHRPYHRLTKITHLLTEITHLRTPPHPLAAHVAYNHSHAHTYTLSRPLSAPPWAMLTPPTPDSRSDLYMRNQRGKYRGPCNWGVYQWSSAVFAGRIMIT